MSNHEEAPDLGHFVSSYIVIYFIIIMVGYFLAIALLFTSMPVYIVLVGGAVLLVGGAVALTLLILKAREVNKQK